MKGQMLGSRSLEDDISLAHSVYANSLQSEVSRRKNAAGLGGPHLMVHIQRVSFVLPVVAVGSVLTSCVPLLGPLAPLGLSFFLRQVTV